MPRLAPRKGTTITADISVPSSWRGWGWPESITLRWSPEEHPDINIVAKGKMTETGPVMTTVTITGDNITPDHLRLPILSALRGAFATTALGPREGGGFTRKEGFALKVPVGTGRPIDPSSARQRLDEVAAIYKKTPRGKKARAVAEHLGINESYARTLMGEARKAGLIE